MLFDRSLYIFSLSHSIWNTSISGVKSNWTSLYNGGTSVADPAKSNDNNRHLGAHNASKPMVTTESVCQQVRKPEKFLV